MTMKVRVKGLQNQLQAIETVLDDMPAEILTQDIGVGGFGTIGQQFRHVINFVEVFLRDYPKGSIDFSRRDRDPALETDEGAIRKRLGELIDEIEGFSQKDADQSLTNIFIPCSKSDPVNDKTTLGNLINTLNEHTNHHLAMIKILGTHGGVEFSDMSVGVAPSTQIYEEHKPDC